MGADNLRHVPAIRRTGRPTGSVNIASRRASKRLEELGFDPISEMVALHDEIAKQLDEMVSAIDSEGNPKQYSQIAYSNLLATKQRCVTELMRYGYARAPESTLAESKQMPALQINLTGSKVDFDTSSLLIRNRDLQAELSRPLDDDDSPMKGPDE